jgi:CotS family spore coat protein
VDIQNFIWEQYGLLVDSVIEHRRPHATNRNVFELLTQNGSYALKEYTWTLTLPFQTSLLSHLEKKGFLQKYKLILTRWQTPLAKMSEKSYMVTEWIAGRKPHFSNIQELIYAAKLLASFHNHAIHLDLDEEILRYAPIEFTTSTFSEIKIGQYINANILKKLTRWVNDFGTDTFRLALERMQYAEYKFPSGEYEQLVEEEKKNKTFVHGDYTSSNLIYTPSGDMMMIDFDDCSYNVRINDLIFLCQLHMGQEIERVLQILQAYHEVRPLSLTEFQVVKSQLLVPARVYWEVHLQCVAGKEISRDWLKRNVDPFLSNKLWKGIKMLSYSDLG